MQIFNHQLATGAETQEKTSLGHAIHIQRRHGHICWRACKDRNNTAADSNPRRHCRQLGQGGQ